MNPTIFNFSNIGGYSGLLDLCIKPGAEGL